MSPKKSNKKTKGTTKAKASLKAKTTPKMKSSSGTSRTGNVAAAKKKLIEKNTSAKLRTTNTSLILESMKRRMAQRKETQLPKRILKIEKPSEDEEESEAKRILKRIMEESESQEEEKRNKEGEEISKEEPEEEEDEIPIEIPEIEMKQPEEKEGEEEKIEAEKEEKEVDEAKVKEQEDEKEETVMERIKETKAPEEEEEEKEMKRFFEPKSQEEVARPMPIIRETQDEPVLEKAEERFNWTRFFVALVSAIVLAAVAGYGFSSLGYSNLNMFAGSFVVLSASTAYFYIVLKNM